MLDNYILGLLYGDGHFTKRDNYEWFLFSITHKELAIKVKSYLEACGIKHFHHDRSFPKGHEKENYEILELVEITDKDFLKVLIENGFKSDKAEERIRWNEHFIRGLLETKGSIFSYESRGNPLWRVSFSGNLQDMNYLKSLLETELNIKTSEIVKRREREEQGIISESYRLNIQNRGGIKDFINFIEGGDCSSYLAESMEKFKKYDKETPFNMKRKVFKHYKYAVGFMAKELGFIIKGERGGGGTRGFKPVYLWNEENTKILGFRGWQSAYRWICEEYTDKTGHVAPLVEDETELNAKIELKIK